jgi:multidrug resistance protein, MATE family
VALTFITPSPDVYKFASDYFLIRIWGAPFVLMNYVVMGWLVGRSRVKMSLILPILMNLINIILAIMFVNVFEWGVSGVAVATLIAEITTFVLSILIIIKLLSKPFSFPSIREIMDPVPFKKMMVMNRDLMIRTLCLLVVFNLITAKGASYGTEILAANAVLIQIHYMMAYTFDGLANASSIYVGKAIGSNNEILYRKVLLISCQWAIFSAVLITGVYFLSKELIISLFTQTQSVIDLTSTYEPWVMLFPISASFGLVLYGVFTGATEAGPIRNSMFYSLIVFLIVLSISVPSLKNHGLWLAFILFSLGRSLFLAMYIPSLNRKIFPVKKGGYEGRSNSI